MGNFSRGLFCGIGIGLIIAPMSGQEMRHLLSERIQNLRQSLPDTGQIQQYGQQISDRATQTASALKDASAQASSRVKDVSAQASSRVKDATSRGENVTQVASSVSKQAKTNIVEATEPSTTQVQSAVQTPPPSPVISSLAMDSVSGSSASNNSLSVIPGMEPEVQSGLEQQGISTISQLLEQTRTKENRADLAQKARITTHQLKTLVDRADLMRLQGIGGDRATLLEEAGIAGCKDLQHRNPEHLHATLIDWQKSGMAASAIPTLDQVTQWIAEAKIMAAAAQV